MDQPQLRPLEAFPVEEAGGRFIILRDPAGFQNEPIAVRPEGYLALSLMDGSRSLGEIQAEFGRRTNQVLPMEDLRAMVASLDERLLLESDHFHQFRAKVEREFAATATRAAVHVEAVYPAEVSALTGVLEGYFTGHRAPRVELDRIRALVAPHIDFGRGWKGFAATYANLATVPPPDTVVLLGTAHYAEEGRFILCNKAFATPFGDLDVDRDMAASLKRRYRHDVERGLLAHRREHSLEFQTVFLAHRYGTRTTRILPILCTTLDDLMRADSEPRAVAEVADFIDALAETVRESGKSILFIAGADLSHTGRQFGDDVDVRGAFAERVAESDKLALAALAGADADDFYRAVAAHQNQYRICSVACLYALLAVAGVRRGQVLHYEQAIDSQGHSLVSFASAVLA